MIDRTKYTWKYAPPVKELVDRWTNKTPTAQEIESFFLNELCETTEHAYFLAVSDLFYDVVEKQTGSELAIALSIIWSRLVDATQAECPERELHDHYMDSVRKFAGLFHEVCLGNREVEATSEQMGGIEQGCLALSAVAMGHDSMARFIQRSDWPVICVNPDCDDYREEQRCSACEQKVTPLEIYEKTW